MSSGNFLKHIQGRISNKTLYKKFIEKLSEEGMTQQGFVLKAVKKFVGPYKKRKKKKKKKLKR